LKKPGELPKTPAPHKFLVGVKKKAGITGRPQTEENTREKKNNGRGERDLSWREKLQMLGEQNQKLVAVGREKTGKRPLARGERFSREEVWKHVRTPS